MADPVFLPMGDFALSTVTFGSPSGTPFVAHGGWIGNWELWQDPFTLMQDRWYCIGYDHRGSGATTAAPEQITPQALVDDLFHVLDHFDIEQCVLAGESLGALTCMTAALQHPERFLGLVLVDGVPAAGGEGSKRLIQGSRADFPATVKWFTDACVPEPDSEHIRRWGRQILLRADAEAAARILEVHNEEQVAPDASRITAPTLLIHGALDAVVPVDLARALAGRIPGAELVVLESTGHVPTLTSPRQVVEAIDSWWQRQGAP